LRQSGHAPWGHHETGQSHGQGTLILSQGAELYSDCCALVDDDDEVGVITPLGMVPK
jgi:hypothetical protein